MPGDAAHAEHERHMRRALELAARGRGLVSPNPMVGAVVVRDGRRGRRGLARGSGNAARRGTALAAAGDRARGATLYCTLEPCDHVGRTPPCTSAIVEAGVARGRRRDRRPEPGGRRPRVRAAPRGRGRGRGRRSSGPDARRLNAAFERHVVTGLPFVTLKTAASLDGKTAARDGTSRWITGEDARDGRARPPRRGGRDRGRRRHRDRRRSLADGPRSVVPRRDPPLRVVVDSSGRVPPDSRIFDGSAPTLGRDHRARRSRARRCVGSERRRGRRPSTATRPAACRCRS